MERVPQIPGFGLVGRGRASTHFSRYLSLLGVPHHVWSRSNGESSWVNFVENSHTLFLLISDDAIESFTEAHPEIQKKTLVHFSGARVIPGVVGMHPLVSFGPSTFDLDFYKSIPFVGEKGKPALSEIIPNLENPYFAIESGQRALYHALCVISGNFTNMLWSRLAEGLEKMGLPESATLPYLESVFENIQRHGAAGLTGPIARNDLKTIESNLNALKEDPFQAVYRAFLKTREPS